MIILAFSTCQNILLELFVYMLASACGWNEVSDQYCSQEQAEKQYAGWLAGEAMRNAEAMPP